MNSLYKLPVDPNGYPIDATRILMHSIWVTHRFHKDYILFHLDFHVDIKLTALIDFHLDSNESPMDFHMDSGGSPIDLHMDSNGFPIVFIKSFIDSDDCNYMRPYDIHQNPYKKWRESMRIHMAISMASHWTPY